MQAINWLELQPLPADLEVLNERLHEALPLHHLCRLLVESTLRLYPWTGRADLIPCYHPSQTYKQGQKIALFISDTQSVQHPIVWLVARVKQVKVAENRIQGRFQVLTLDVRGKQIQMAAGIPEASYLEPDLSSYTAEDLAWLVEWISETYAASLQATLKTLIQRGQIHGGLSGEIFLPERVSGLSPELLHPIFAGLSAERLWIHLDEIVKDLPDLSPLTRENVLGLLPATLKESPYRSLGAGRWTTPEQFRQLDWDVLQGLPTHQVRSNVHIWTRRDERDLAGYDKKFMPTEARRALEELGIVEKLPEQDESLWRPPKDPLQLPRLHCLHMTQAYFPIHSVMHAFAPEVQLVFVQFINGDHQPFLLDREKSALKAVHPETLLTRILQEGIPAGTHLWLEYEGNEGYRIAPRRLPFKRMVPCKLAHLVDGRLHIKHTQISMTYDGAPSLFKADLRSEEIKSLFAEAARVNLSLQEAMIYAIQEICATDPDYRAHQSDIFNAVFLQRMCSPRSVALLLYTQPCFEKLAGGYFRYRPLPDIPVKKPRKRKDRLSKLWDNLLSTPVAPDPIAAESLTLEGGLNDPYPVFPPFTADLRPPSVSQGRETDPEFSVLSLPLVAVEAEAAAQTVLQEEARIESLLLRGDEADAFPPADSHPWRDSLDRLLHSVEALVNDEPSAAPAEEGTSESEALSESELSMKAAHEEALSFSSSFPQEPRPAWVKVQSQPNPASTLPRAYIPKIPTRPLHKQPLYRRLFYYLRLWLSRISRKTI
jgi:hypothetical protein